MTLILSKDEVEGLLDLDRAMDVTLNVLREQAAGEIVAIAPRHVPVRRDGALRIVTGALLDSSRMGVRVGPAVALASSRGTALLYDADTGDLLCAMAYPFGTLRTGANIGLATRFFARPEARTVAMIGSGRNALSLLTAVCHVRPIEAVRVYSRNADRRTTFARNAQAALERNVTTSDDAATATRDADIVLIATDSPTPVLTADCIAGGAFVATMGRPSELDPDAYRRADLIVVGHKQQEEQYFDSTRFVHQLMKLVSEGEIPWQDVVELADVAVGKAPGRTSPAQTIVFKESQGGFGDIGFADFVYTEALQRGLGEQVQLQ